MSDHDESGTARYRCETCGRVATFPDVAVTPIGRGVCTDADSCVRRKARAARS